MIVFFTQYTTIVRKYGLRNIVRKIWRGGIFFSLIHSAVFWYGKYQIGDWGDRMSAVIRTYESRNSLWKAVSAVLEAPFGFIETSGYAYFGLMVLNSILWGVILSFLIVPAFVKRGD
jgi:hypothetical protein